MSEVSPRPEVKWFADLMELALQRNDPKYGGNSWKDADVDNLIQALEEHLAKLKIRRDEGKGKQQLVYDAADCGNFAMMIADVAQNSGEAKNESYRLTGEESSILGYLAKVPSVKNLNEVRDRLGEHALAIAKMLVGESQPHEDESAAKAAESMRKWAGKPSLGAILPDEHQPPIILPRTRHIILFHQPATDSEIQTLRTYPGLTIVDETRKAFLIEASKEVIAKLQEEGWRINPVV